MRIATLLAACLPALSCLALTPMPDAALRTWANTNFPGCIVGTSIDEDHPGVQAATFLDLSFVGTVTDLTGMEAFVNATEMNVSNNPISVWSGPPNLQSLGASNCGIAGTFAVPYMITTLLISYNAITNLVIPDGANLSTLYAHHNQLTTVVGASGLNWADLSYNQFTSLAGFSAPFLLWLDVSHNLLTTMPNGGNNLNNLNVSWNQITSVAQLSGTNSLVVDLRHNAIQSVATTGTAHTVDLSFNPLTQGIARLGTQLRSLRVSDTQLPCLPYLNSGLQTLYCTNSPINCLPNQPANLNTSAANLGFTAVVCGATSPCYVAPTSVDLRMLLQGPYDANTQLMRDDLRAQGLLPAADPYPALGVTYAGTGWPGVQDPAVLNATSVDAVVDWVVVELRTPGAPHTVVASRPALLQRDGDVVGTNGSLVVGFNAPAGTYRIAVRHRNHLGVMSGMGYGLGTLPVQLDLSLTNTSTYGTNAQVQVGTRMALWAGDATRNGTIQYTGSTNDRDPLLVAVGSTTPNAVLLPVYDVRDLNLDGAVKYTGSGNDRDIVLQTVGGTTPNSVRQQQLP